MIHFDCARAAFWFFTGILFIAASLGAWAQANEEREDPQP